MARGHFMSLCRRWSQLTAGLSTAAKKSAITNQPTKVLTCQSKKNAPSTTAAVNRATATVRITWVGEALAHPASLLGMEALGSAGVVWVCAFGSACGCACEFFCGASFFCGVSSSFMTSSLWYGRVGHLRLLPGIH